MLLNVTDTIVLNKSRALPANGIICAHPGRVKRIATQFLDRVKLHTDYRGYQVYEGFYSDQRVFVASTGIGAPAAAFLIEELVAFGAKRIIRLGSDDSAFGGYVLKLVEETTLPLGLKDEYGVVEESVKINPYLRGTINKLSRQELFCVRNRHIDSYYVSNFSHKSQDASYGSSDMESGALYLLGQLRGLEYATLLLSYPKHDNAEYGDGGRSFELEEKGIRLALASLCH